MAEIRGPLEWKKNIQGRQVAFSSDHLCSFSNWLQARYIDLICY